MSDPATPPSSPNPDAGTAAPGDDGALAVGEAATPLGGAAGGSRLVVPDVLRGIALLAMLIAHAAPFVRDLPGPVIFVQGNINDLASPLFVMVMGMSTQLVVQRTPAAGRGLMLVQQAIRALILIGLGVWMATWGSWVAVVLAYLGVTLIVGTPFLFLRTRWLAASAFIAVIVSAPLNAWARDALSWVGNDPTGIAREVANWLVLGGAYRMTNLLPFFLFGAILIRHGLKRDRMLWVLLAIAPAAYIVRPVLERVTGSMYPSGSYPDTLHDIGLVFATYVAVVLLAAVTSPGARRVIAVVFEPLRAIGQVALSLYLLHVAVIALWITYFIRPGENDWIAWLVTVPGMVLIGWAWWRYVGPGPVEWLMGWATGRPRRRTRRATE